MCLETLHIYVVYEGIYAFVHVIQLSLASQASCGCVPEGVLTGRQLRTFSRSVSGFKPHNLSFYSSKCLQTACILSLYEYRNEQPAVGSLLYLFIPELELQVAKQISSS